MEECSLYINLAISGANLSFILGRKMPRKVVYERNGLGEMILNLAAFGICDTPHNPHFHHRSANRPCYGPLLTGATAEREQGGQTHASAGHSTSPWPVKYGGGMTCQGSWSESL